MCVPWFYGGGGFESSHVTSMCVCVRVDRGGVDGIVMETCWHGSVFLQVLTLQLHPKGIARDWGPHSPVPSPVLTQTEYCKTIQI